MLNDGVDRSGKREDDSQKNREDIDEADEVDPESDMMGSDNEDEDSEIDEENEILATLSNHTGEVKCVRWSPTGKFLASASMDKTIIIWSIEHSHYKKKFGEV